MAQVFLTVHDRPFTVCTHDPLGLALDEGDAIQPAMVTAALAETKLGGVELNCTEVAQVTERISPLLDAGIELIGIAAGLQMPQHLGGGSAWLDPLRRWVMAAAEVGSPQVRLSLRRSPRRPSITRLADQLGSIGEMAAEVSVRVLLDAEGALESAADLWRVLELTDSSNLAASLPLTIEPALPTGAADEVADQSATVYRPLTGRRELARCAAVSIPLLNSRIRHASIQCAVPIATPPRWLSNALHHLRGVGYAGWLTIAAPRDSLQACATMLRPLAELAVPVKK